MMLGPGGRGAHVLTLLCNQINIDFERELKCIFILENFEP